MALRIPMEDSIAISAAASEVERDCGRVDVLVNSAGTTRAVPHADREALDHASFDHVLVTVGTMKLSMIG